MRYVNLQNAYAIYRKCDIDLHEPQPCVWARVIPNVPSITHMRSLFTLRKCVSDFLSGTKKWNQLRASAQRLMERI